MATTTKKSSKAKTKTAKAKSSKATKSTKTTSKRTTAARTTAAKTTKKVSQKPAEKAVEIRQTSSTKSTKSISASWRVATVARLRSLHLMSAGLFLALAVAAGLLMSDASRQVTIGHLTRDALASSKTTVFTPAVYVLHDIEVRWVVVALMTLSAVLPVLYMTKLQTRYQDYVQKTRMLPFRWIEAGIISALMTEVVAVLYGITDLVALKLIGGTVFIAALLAIIAERQNDKASRPIRSAHLTGVLAGLLPIAVLGMTGAATYLYGMIRSPWYVYATYTVLIVGFVLVARNQWRFISRDTKVADSVTAERNYLVITALVRAAFAVVLIVGLRAA